MKQLSRHILGTSAALLVVAAQTFGADLLADNFTDPAASSGLWIKDIHSTMTATVNGGSCTLDNSASQYIGEYSHSFSGSKPATFTISYILKSVQGNNIVGVFFCRQADNPAGYILTAKDNTVLVYKVSTTGSSISANPIFQERSPDLNPTDNKLTVSKNGSTFNVFTNDVFIGSFTDASYNSGDLSLVMFNNTKAVFGAIHVTDTFTSGQKRTEFSDDFNDNSINKYWKQDITSGGTAPTITETDGKLRMTAAANAGAYIYVDIDLTDFEAKVEVNHVAGRSDSPYGIFLVGDDASTQMVKFFIVGGRYYGTWKSGGSTQPMTANPKIHGSEPVAGVILSDTLTLKKKDDSPNYEFFVNGEPLTINISPINFPIKRIGLLCDDNVTVAFDNFSVKQNYPVSVWKNDKKQVSRRPSPIVTANRAFYDMRGRKRYSLTADQNRAQVRAAGIYVNKNGRDVATRKGKAAKE